jgi:hypothetical protein
VATLKEEHQPDEGFNDPVNDNLYKSENSR